MSHDRLNWENTLWDAGHRVTRQRALILDAVCAAAGHTTLGEIYLRVRRSDASIDRSTVYRALRLFSELGIVLAADTGRGEMLYEVGRPRPHHHLICRHCGAEQEVDDEGLRTLEQAMLDRHGFRLAIDHLVLPGLCAGCQRDRSG